MAKNEERARHNTLEKKDDKKIKELHKEYELFMKCQ